MTTLETPYRIVRITKLPEGGETRRLYGHYTTKYSADSVCDALKPAATEDTLYVVEPVTPN